MQLVTWEPFGNINRIQSRLYDLFDENFGRSWVNAATAGWHPAVDVLESKEAYLIRAELPGMRKEDFNLEVKDGMLVLTAERKADKPADGVEYRARERVNGKFLRSFVLPESVKLDGIEAGYKDGILEISVPKVEEAKPRQIEVTVH